MPYIFCLLLLLVLPSRLNAAAALGEECSQKDFGYHSAESERKASFRPLTLLRRQVSGPFETWVGPQILNRSFLEKIFREGVLFHDELLNQVAPPAARKYLKIDGECRVECYGDRRIPLRHGDSNPPISFRITPVYSSERDMCASVGGAEKKEESLPCLVPKLEKVFLKFEENRWVELKRIDATDEEMEPSEKFERIIYGRSDTKTREEDSVFSSEIYWRVNIEKGEGGLFNIPNVEILFKTTQHFLRGFYLGLALSFDVYHGKPFIFYSYTDREKTFEEDKVRYNLVLGVNEEHVCSDSKDFILGVMAAINLFFGDEA